MKPYQLLSSSFLATAFLLGSTACSEENAAKYAVWLGTKTINEKNADRYAAESVRILKKCRIDDEICYANAKEYLKKSSDLYIRDCDFGNKSACRKLTDLLDEWDEIHQKAL